MSGDLVRRLREQAQDPGPIQAHAGAGEQWERRSKLLTQAADEIERLNRLCYPGQGEGAMPWPVRVDELRRIAEKQQAENKRLRSALEQIASFPDEGMETARTLHYDMRGWAKRALDATPGDVR